MYTDDNGLVYFESADNVAPLHSTLNTLTSSVSGLFDSTVQTFTVANEVARDDLFSDVGAPLQVYREDLQATQHNFGEGWQTGTSQRRIITNYEDVFASVASGVSILSMQSTYEVYPGEPFGWMDMRFTVQGLSLPSGNISQATGNIGTLQSWCMPINAVPISAYYTNGSVQGALTGAGIMSFRWSSGSSSATKYCQVSFATEVDS